MAYALAVEEISAGDGATGALMSIHNSGGRGPLLAYGTPEQQQAWLPRLARGEGIGWFWPKRESVVVGKRGDFRGAPVT